MQTMVERDAKYTLCGNVQADDAYLGGELAGGKADRGSENKVLFVAAISLSSEGRPLYIKMALSRSEPDDRLPEQSPDYARSISDHAPRKHRR